ncbi:MAG: urease accessory protein UreG [Solirubrobacteraceae bacterium]|nr:urease accessory protein UreG [Solirubrobacteraceae bacterium]
MRIGVGGPVGSGKSSLVAALCRELAATTRIGVVTNDIYTTEDAQFLRATGVLDAQRIVAVQTGCCPHTAIRDDISTNLEAVADLELATGPLDLVFVESGGDNLTAVFSPALADAQIFVIDVAGGDDIPRKGGPGIARADLLVINKTDLAPYVRSDVALMVTDARARRGELPVEAVSLMSAGGAAPVARWVLERLTAFRVDGRLDSGVAPLDEEPHHHVH